MGIPLGEGKLCKITAISSLNALETTAPNIKEHDRQNVLLGIQGFLSVVLRNCNRQELERGLCMSHG